MRRSAVISHVARIPPLATDDERDGCPTIGDGVNVGVGAKIIGPIIVGSNCSIGANAVVTHSFADGNVLVGIPAKAI